ncbi:MAG: glutamate mutase L [Gracilibacteraceae bacterium]|jgi:hypothetical protein|nr:glutamate mutase L [Gracilibacteraceae bacterium]
MGQSKLFIDFGSTYTKVVAFDLEREELLGRVQAPSTVGTDIMLGLEAALSLMAEIVPVSAAMRRQAVASSSAAGGLRVVCVGLVPEYTTEAARMAALGAGARIVGTCSYELTRREMSEIERLAPDIVLLTGGTDGGNRRVITANGRMLALSKVVKNIIVAGNKSARDDLEDAFASSSINVVYTDNAMPEIGILNLDKVNAQIRDLFLHRITEAKGISRVRSVISGVIMPTPAAVMAAAQLLAQGVKGRAGLGELLLVDVGGATTDVYSVAKGLPTRTGVTMLGLPQPWAKRTVEGDLGLFHNLDALAELAATGDGASPPGDLVQRLQANNGLPADEDVPGHLHLSRLAVKTAVDRHVGRIEQVYTVQGEHFVQRGKDLTRIQLLIGAGGPVAFSPDPLQVLSGAIFEETAANVLKPVSPSVLLDERYILFAIGLLAQSEPAKALTIAKKYLKTLRKEGWPCST